MSDPQDLSQFNQEELLKTKQIKTTTARSPRGSTVFEQGTKTEAGSEAEDLCGPEVGTGLTSGSLRGVDS